MVMMFNIDLRLLNVPQTSFGPPPAARHSLLCAIDW
jgi:hypothetical protein